MEVADTWMIGLGVGRHPSFLRLVRPQLDLIQELDLDWCELMPKQFGGTYGGWISDNYLAIGRLSPWLYSGILILDPAEPYVEPINSLDRWSAKECKIFLNQRGMKIPQKVDDKRKAIALEKSKPPSERLPILETPTCTAEEVYECITRMFLLLSRLYEHTTDGDDSVNLLRVCIRLYLSSFDRVDLATRESRTAPPRWLSSYNFMCLLNIPDTVAKFGPYKNFYEGKFCGEGYNRILKPTANRSAYRNRCLNLLRNIGREKAMAAVQSHSDGELGNFEHENNNNKRLIYRMAHRYMNKRKVSDHYRKNYPLSVLLFRVSDQPDGNRRHGLCYVFRGKVFVSPIEKDIETAMVVAGVVTYWHWTLKPFVSDSIPLESVLILDYGLLLPRIADPNRRGQLLESNYYTIITHIWNSEESVQYR
jgi:hypothetical protein